jgi:diadenosine tetraphosphate (Ap4A) HIT family hydrolase
MNYTVRDIARLALSARLRDLSEDMRLAVAAPGHDGGGRLAELLDRLESGLPQLRDVLTAYLRALDGSDQTALAGIPAVDDPDKLAGELDEWYVRRAQLEPLARYSDPVSRLLDARTPAPDDCLVCRKYAGETIPPMAGRAQPPGGPVIDDPLWRVGHGPTAFWPKGTLLVESRRHFLDYAEFQPEEAAAIGPLISSLIGPIKEATGAPRVHVFSSMEGAPHFHVWLVPRTAEGSRVGRAFIGSPGTSTEAEAEEAVGRIRGALRRSTAEAGR